MRRALKEPEATYQKNLEEFFEFFRSAPIYGYPYRTGGSIFHDHVSNVVEVTAIGRTVNEGVYAVIRTHQRTYLLSSLWLRGEEKPYYSAHILADHYEGNGVITSIFLALDISPYGPNGDL